jgi:class 3 adenylate cyclase
MNADGLRRPSVPDLPAGVITLLFTDIEGSTGLWERYPRTMPAALDRHDTIVRAAVEGAGGVVFRTVGDAFFAAFQDAVAGMRAALVAQRALYAEAWGRLFAAPDVEPPAQPRGPRIAVRMALHTGPVEMRDRDYLGPALNRVARIMAAGHGGQTLLCHITHELVRDHVPSDVTLLDLAEHYLKDLIEPEHIFQLAANDLPAEFPPLKTLTNQAAAASAARADALAAAISHQHRLPGMPSIDFDAVLRKERERQRKTRKGKKGGSG